MYCSVIIFSRPLEPLSYQIRSDVRVGTIVQVPLGRQSCTGIITAVTDKKPDYEGRIRHVLEVVDPNPFISEGLMATLRFMSSYYQCPLGFCLKLAMPSGMMRSGVCRYYAGDAGILATQEGLLKCQNLEKSFIAEEKAPKREKKTANQGRMLFGTDFKDEASLESHGLVIQHVLAALESGGLTETEISHQFGVKSELLEAWVMDGLLVPQWELDKARQQETMEAVYTVTDAEVPKKLGKKQQELLDWMAEQGMPVRHSAVLERFGSCSPVLHRLEELGLISVQTTTRDKTSFDHVKPIIHEIERTDEQQAAIDAVVSHQGFGSFLLFGVTGSGKTEVYLGVMEAVRARGQGCIFILPEIALTPQFCAVFQGRFGNDVAVLHSGLSENERFDTWSRIRAGRIGIAIGPRSALFAPVQNLGLIVLDEEHDSSFKQGETPRYHARDMALYLGQQCGCPVILGSATPSLESYARALQNRMQLLQLTKRPQARPMPEIQIVDMRNRAKPVFEDDVPPDERVRIEVRSRLLSDDLIVALKEVMERKEQAMIFLNRRGFSTFIQCEYCGNVLYCPNCDVALTYYKYSDDLHCHYCDYVDRTDGFCPKCRRRDLSYTGYGTERLVEVLSAEFPEARVERLDRDNATNRGIQNILGAFRSGDIDILVGTQMIAKGHDIHNVTLVGIVNADMGLHMPDFRASERTYQLLTQVSGRAGRGNRPGRVILQTLRPEHPAIQGVVERDYTGFAQQELEIRRALMNSPFTHLVMMRIEGTNPIDTERYACHLASAARGLQGEGTTGRVMGPAPAPIPILCGKTRYQLFLRHENRAKLHAWLNATLQKTADWRANTHQIHLTVDVDPYDML